MTTLRTTTTTEFRKRVYFDGSPTHVFNDKCITTLMKACMHGRPEQVKLILEEKPLTVVERDGVFKTALHYCAENDEQDADCAKLLLDADASIVDIPDDDGHTALHLAVIAGNLPLVRFLLVSGQADPNKRDAEGHSTVHWATVCADVDALEMVLSHGGTTSSADVHGGYAIHYAAQMCGTGMCRSGDARNVGVRVLQLLLSFGADVHVTDKHGRQPILWAASAGSADAIITLVNGGANVESHDKDGLTALHCAASRGHVECVDALLSLCGSEVDAVDSNSCSALFYAVTLGHADATEILLEHGANPDRQDGKGRTPAHCGAFKGQFETVRILAEHGANLWLRNAKGGYPLHDAMRSGRKELVLWLLSMRPESVDYYDDDGKRPLHIAALNNNLEMSKIVLDSGASINPVMKIKGERMTPLDVALRKSNRHLAKFLNLYGGKPASKLNKTLSKQQSTIRVKTKRTESRRNSYSSDSISRKYRTGSGRKKQATQRKGESSKANKTPKGRVVQVHIRADVLTKTIGKSRDDKKSCCGGGGTLPKAQRKKASAVVESKECFSENDMCYGDGDGYDRDYDRDYDYGYDDDDDDDDDEDDDEDEGDGGRRGGRRDGGGGCDGYDMDDGEDEDSGGGHEAADDGSRGGRVEEQTNGSAAQAAADRCKDGRRRRNRRRGNRTTGPQDGGREPRAAADKAEADKTVADKTGTDKTGADKPVAGKSVADKPVADKPVADKTEADKPVADKSAADKTAADKTAAGKSVTDKTEADKPVADKPAADKTVADKSAADKPEASAVAVRRDESTTVAAGVAAAVAGARTTAASVVGSGDTDGRNERPRSPTAGDGRDAEKPKANAKRADVQTDDGRGEDDGRRTEVTAKQVSAAAAAAAAHDEGPSIVAVIPDDGPPAAGKRVEPQPPADKAAVGRTTSTEGGKSTTGPSKAVGGGGGGGGGGGRAIVEILDRVDTPPRPSSATVAGVDGRGGPGVDGGGGGGVGDDEPVAFSVLPNRGRDDAPFPCECRDCVKKPKRSSSKKMKSRIPRLNNYCSLAPTSDLNTMSVTKAVQLSSRKYHLERLIFYQLSELKRLQIRAGKSDERVLVKRLVEEYGRTGLFTGLKRYDGPFSFKRFEKYLYDQLLVLQRQSLADNKYVIPRVKTIEEIDKLTGALRRIDAGKTVVENPNDCLACIQTTNRCFHATHAYTGVPCAAYIPKFRLDHHQMPKPADGRRRFLPDIRQQHHQHDTTAAARCSLRNVDPSRPITLQLANGPCTQAIDLPTDKLDKNKRYLVTFTIKGADGGPQSKHRPTAAGPQSFRDGLHRRHHHHGADDCHPPLAHTHAKSF